MVVSLTPGTGAPDAALTGVTSASTILGVATFSNLNIDLAELGYRVTASSAGLTIDSDPFDIESASAGQLRRS